MDFEKSIGITFSKAKSEDIAKTMASEDCHNNADCVDGETSNGSSDPMKETPRILHHGFPCLRRSTQEEREAAVSSFKTICALEEKRREAETMKSESENEDKNAFDSKTQEFLKEFGEKEIHRVCRIDSFYKLIGGFCDGTCSNALVKLPLWDDKNEGYFYRLEKYLKGRTRIRPQKDWLDMVFGQCWSLNDERDTCYMWDFYGRNERANCVQVTTTVSKLWKSLSDHLDTNKKKAFAYMDKVEYIPLREHLERLVEQDDSFRNTLDLNRDFIGTLFQKAEQYSFEDEIRLLVSCENGVWEDFNPANRQIFEYCISPVELIERIVASPYMSSGQLKELRNIVEHSIIGGRLSVEESTLFPKFDSPQPDSRSGMNEETKRGVCELLVDLCSCLESFLSENSPSQKRCFHYISEAIVHLSSGLGRFSGDIPFPPLDSCGTIDLEKIKSKIKTLLRTIETVLGDAFPSRENDGRWMKSELGAALDLVSAACNEKRFGPENDS